MIEQQARILERNGGRIWVEIGGQTGCSACDAGQGCGAGLFGKLLRRSPIKLELTAKKSHQPGQALQLGLPEILFLKLVFILYGVPLLAGLVGGATGVAIASSIGLNGGQADLLILFAALLVAVLVLKFRHRTLKPELGEEQIHIVNSVQADITCSGSGFLQDKEVRK